MIESKVREGVFHKVVKDLETGKAVSCSCKCWSKGNKPCAGMRTVGFDKQILNYALKNRSKMKSLVNFQIKNKNNSRIITGINNWA